MRKAVLLIILMLMSVVLAESTASSPALISVDSRGVESECNVSPVFIESIKGPLIEELNMSPYAFSNVTNSYCYSYGDYQSININFLFKESESSITGKSVSASFYTSSTNDYSVLFNDREMNMIGYSLKEKYADYVVNGTNDEYYIQLSGDCDELRSYYETLNGEKYFNNDYCSIVIKTSTSMIKEFVVSSVDYVNYFSDEVKYLFTGYSTGSYDLASLSTSLNCDLSMRDYYYPEIDTNCYGIYKDKTRVYFSAYNDQAYLNVYGIIGAKGKIVASAYGEELDAQKISDWVNSVLNEYFPGYSLTLTSDDYSLQGEVIIDNFNFNTALLSDFDSSKDIMNTFYYKDNYQVTITEPYIQVFAPETGVRSISDDELLLRPYYWGSNFVITNDRVYSSVTLDDNNMTLAVEKLRDFINPYITTSDWELNMSVTGNVYYYLLKGVDQASSLNAERAPTMVGASDSLSAEYDEFAELEALSQPTILDSIINFFKSLFGLN
ncbi:MAG: hypothetical protein WC307_00465 [Candidatus Nanoarchaeia archaeon]|jgi:hypothetical protein